VSRLDDVLDRLTQAADGKRRLPVIRADDAEAVCGHFHAQVDRGTEARERAVEAAGHRVACGEGCSACCRTIPAILAGEAVAIARWLDRPENVAVRERFLEEYPKWYEQVGDLVEAHVTATAAGDEPGVLEAFRAVMRRGVMCAFNQDGRCTIYEVRPIVCRNAHALDVRCDPAKVDTLEYFDFEPLDEYVERLRPVSMAMHRSLRRDGAGPRPLCVHVFEALAHPPYFGSK
jgi:Fe-S-cluster containining protein